MLTYNKNIRGMCSPEKQKRYIVTFDFFSQIDKQYKFFFGHIVWPYSIVQYDYSVFSIYWRTVCQAVCRQSSPMTCSMKGN